jgi:hypothetical protein
MRGSEDFEGVQANTNAVGAMIELDLSLILQHSISAAVSLAAPGLTLKRDGLGRIAIALWLIACA